MAKNDTSLNVNSITIISAGTSINGEVVSPTDIRIDGTVEGKLIAKGRVVIGESAVIKGTVICDNLDLWGKAEGNIYAKDILSLKEGCRMDGGIHIRRLSVELGAIFNGTCRTISEEEFAKLTAPASAKEAAKASVDKPQTSKSDTVTNSVKQAHKSTSQKSTSARAN